ncbi:MAG: phosphomannomutase/phosphoglucomutase [Gammaproteobacteria bacterium]
MDGPIKRRRIKRRTLRNIIIGALVLTIGLGLIFGVRSYFDAKQAREMELLQRQAETASQQVAVRTSQSIGVQLAELDAVAADPEVQAALQANDTQALEALADRQRARFDKVINLRIFTPRGYGLEPDATPPLTYASLDLLNKARDGEQIRAELHRHDSDDAHIVLIKRVEAAVGNLLGLLHLSLQPALVEEALARGDLANGHFEIKQFADNSPPLVLFSGGNPAYKGQALSAVAPITNTRWSVEFWFAADGAPPPADFDNQLEIPWWTLILIIALIGAGIFWRQRAGTSSGSLAADNVTYDGAVKALMEGVHPGLEKLVPHLPAYTGPASNAASETADKPSVPLEGDDITSIAIPAKKPTDKAAETDSAPPKKFNIAAGIFRAYDIRGVVETDLTPEAVHEIGRALGSEARARKQGGMVVGRDGRTHSPALSEELIKGLRASGVDVIDIGQVATPVLYFATHYLEAHSGVMLTGSHNGPEYNGLKMVLAGETLSGDTVQALYKRIQEGKFSSGQGSLQSVDILSNYIRRIVEDIPTALGNSFKIVVDAGNGVAGQIAPQVYKALGHDVVELFCDVDGNFPNHHPDPSQPENLQALIAKVKETGADIGFAFDGDGDRLGVVDGEGNIIWPDRQLMLLAKDVLSRNAGATIIFDVKCSRYLKAIIELSGGKPLMWKTGHSLIKSKMKEVNAPLAGEMSGHIFFKERWYGFDDAIYTGARMLEILMQSKEKPVAVFADLPGGIATPELRINLAETGHADVMLALRDKLNTDTADLTDIDGLRLDFADGWGLVRPSNTSPCLVARFEAEDAAALERIQGVFKQALLAVNPDMQLPF